MSKNDNDNRRSDSLARGGGRADGEPRPAERVHVISTPENIALFRMSMIMQYARARANGIELTRRSVVPKIKDINRQYGIKAKTWSEVAEQLATLTADIDAGDSQIPEGAIVR